MHVYGPIEEYFDALHQKRRRNSNQLSGVRSTGASAPIGKY